MSQVQRLGTSSKTGSVVYAIKNLSVEFTKSQGFITRERKVIKAVSNISLDVLEGEVLSIVGESGSGKTTIARCLIGTIQPTSGSIKFLGDTEVVGLKGSKLLNYWKNVQMIFQDPFESMYPKFDVFTIISIPIVQLTGQRDKTALRNQVEKLLREVGLDPAETMHKLPHQLSGGERQRVSIARALAPNPKVLIADEPITMLDASLRLNILSLLLEIRAKRNLTVVLITHDLASAKVMSDRIAVMYYGKLVEFGKTNEILTRPVHPYTELILSSTPRIGMKREAKKKSSGEIEVVASGGCIFRSRCKYASEICRSTEPKLEEKRKEGWAACHNPLAA